ncbi:UNKNOWN [Stylonychia lemnae]|uniref:Uncharacterized protein n=1 Tax=Stylonychia lemnae TaxID=5949 RepID=A0A078A9Z3_STYLE|nr:UNKNOWN [Stylonychia lemnae]|eukprot:CDW78372.1 UNKNOWN [Stylonychia lemnae]
MLFKSQDSVLTIQQYQNKKKNHPLHLEHLKIGRFRELNQINQSMLRIIMLELVPESYLINWRNAQNLNYVLLNSFRNVAKVNHKVKLIGEIRQAEENNDDL